MSRKVMVRLKGGVGKQLFGYAAARQLAGGDCCIEALGGTRVVRSWGEDAVAIPFVDGFATTSYLFKHIRSG